MSWTKVELEAYAEAEEISLVGASTKAEILAVIYTAEKTEPVEEWGLSVVVAYALLHEVELTDAADLEGSVVEIHAVWESGIKV